MASLPQSPNDSLLPVQYPLDTNTLSNAYFNKQNIPILHFLHQEHTVIQLYPFACPVNSRKTLLHSNHPKLLSSFHRIMRKQIIVSREVGKILRLVISNSIDFQIAWNAYTHIFLSFNTRLSGVHIDMQPRHCMRVDVSLLSLHNFVLFSSVNPSNRTFIRNRAYPPG